MNKAFSNFTWENDPSVNTPLSAENLNRVNKAVNEIDNRVISHDTTKANQVDMLSAITNVTFDESTGKFTFIRHNGTMVVLDTKLEKLILNWRFDNTTQILYMVLEDGSEMPVDLSAFITNVEFTDSDTIRAVIGTDGKVGFDIIDGSITGNKLQPNYLADVQLAATQASQSSTNAQESADNAEASALRAEKAAEEASAAVGGDFAPNSRVDDIISGNTKVGNADKLDGHDSEYFATAESVDNLHALIQPSIFEGMDAVKVPTILNVNGGVIIDPISVGGDGGYGLFGTVDSDGNPLCMMSLNSDGTMALIGRNAGMVLTDFNAPNYITPSAIGAATTADLANYVPLNGGGTVKGKVNVEANEGIPLGVKNTGADVNVIGFYGKSGTLGHFGFNGAENPVFLSATNGYLQLHHDGNSAKVAIQSSAPTDTTSLWVY